MKIPRCFGLLGVVTLAAVALTLAAPDPARGAKSDADRFEKSLQKIDRKGYCICHIPSLTADPLTGVLVHHFVCLGGEPCRFLVFCEVPEFNFDGSSTGLSSGCSEFQVVGP